MTLFALPAARATGAPRLSARLRRALPCVAVAAAGLAAFALPAAPADIEPPLALLLRFMAALKGAAVLGALGLALWRLRAPAPPAALAGYIVALAAMAAAPGLIASLAHVVAGAVLFHAGLLGYAATALRDDAVLPRRRPRR